MVSQVAEIRSVERSKPIRALVDAGLIQFSRRSDTTLTASSHGSDVVVTDYLQRNPSRSQVLEARERRAQSEKSRRLNKPTTGHADAGPQERDSAPIPIPIPIPIPSHDPPIGPPGDTKPPESKTDRKKRASALPEDLNPNAAALALARELAVALETELPAFIDHHRAKGSVFSDWQAALRTWIRNAARYGPAKRIPGARPYQPQDDRLQRQADRITMLRKQEAAEEAAAKGTHP
jgi:hypothetical protein